MRGRVEVVRGGVVESVHAFHAAVVSQAGELLRVGTPETVAFFRSSAKPFQTVGLLLSGAGDAFRLDERDLALTAASHAGEGVHTAGVEALLEKAHLTKEHLLCGAHAPYDKETAEALPGPPTTLHSNCSGKHAGMLLQAVHEGWSLDYLDPDHPVQVRNRAVVASFAGMAPDRLGLGVDGCGVPTFALPVTHMARAYLRLARPAGLPAAWREAAGRVLRAMVRHPRLVGGRSQFTTRAMEALEGRMMAKGGAEGVFCGVLPGAGIAFALKVADGSHRAVPPAAVGLLDHLGLLDPRQKEALLAFGHPPLRNVAGRSVGEIRPVLSDDGEGER